jgi:hypothetical protein
MASDFLIAIAAALDVEMAKELAVGAEDPRVEPKTMQVEGDVEHPCQADGAGLPSPRAPGEARSAGRRRGGAGAWARPQARLLNPRGAARRRAHAARKR